MHTDETIAALKSKFAAERTHFPALNNSSYLMTGSTGLIPDYVYDAVRDYEDRRYMYGGDSVWEDGIDSLTMMTRSQQRLAEMLICNPDDIAFAGNTTQALSYYTANIAIKPGDNVVMPADAFITTKYLWQVRQPEGLEIRYAPVHDGMVEPEDIFSLIDARTIAVSCSLVESKTGFRIDAEQIGKYCRARGIAFIVDAAQAAGVLDINVQKMCADVLASGDYKWMMGYAGTAFAYIRPELRQKIMPRAAGWMADENRFNIDKDQIELRSDAGRFLLGYPNMPGINAFGLTAKRYNELGRADIARYVAYLTEYLRQRAMTSDSTGLLFNFPEKNRSQLTSVLVDESRGVTEELLKQRGVSCAVRGIDEMTGMRVLRVGLHYYNNTDDIDRLFDAIGC